jgi:hypothetical protein
MLAPYGIGSGMSEFNQVTNRLYEDLRRQGSSPTEAVAELANAGVPFAMAQACLEHERNKAELLLADRSVPIMTTEQAAYGAWYAGPTNDGVWAGLKELLRHEGRIPIDPLDDQSTKVVAHLPPPYVSRAAGRGLVLGYVQSGKTANYVATIAKAVDAGYRLVVVLSGLHNGLRKQTQSRLVRQLVAPNTARWFQLTDEDRDFGSPGNADNLLTSRDSYLLAVVKKNPTRLQNLLDWLNSASRANRAACPVLVIDDEGDQASINTKDEEQQSRIHSQIRELLEQPRVALVSYTATPFANLLTNPQYPGDLYPKDFILDLPAPPGYFGPEHVFGRERLTEDEEESDGYDMIRRVSETDAEELAPPAGKKEDRVGYISPVPSSLKAAVRWFVLASAARRARGDGGQHSTMLVHTSMLTDVHFALLDPLRRTVEALAADISRNDVAHLQEQWEQEQLLLPPEDVGQGALAFNVLVPHLKTVCDAISIKVDNSTSVDRLDYDTAPQTVIVIGGNTMSRGLTLEGLVVSYFTRTAGAYDTLLQMGRWFGYRPNYEDLPRIWTTDELRSQFRDLALVEREIRATIARYEAEAKTPLELAVRLRTHKSLAVTAANKMSHAVEQRISYSNDDVQTLLFDHNNEVAGQYHLELLRTTLDGIAATSTPEPVGASWLFQGVAASQVQHFLAGYRFLHQPSLDARTVKEYINERVSDEELTSWNVALIGRGGEGRSFGGNVVVNPVRRARMKELRDHSYADVKSLMSNADRSIDLPGSRPKGETDAAFRARRSVLAPAIPLLLLYPIDARSEPRSAARVALDAKVDQVGFAIVFPHTNSWDRGAVSYVAAPIPGLLDADESDDFDQFVDTEGDSSEAL